MLVTHEENDQVFINHSPLYRMEGAESSTHAFCERIQTEFKQFVSTFSVITQRFGTLLNVAETHVQVRIIKAALHFF